MSKYKVGDKFVIEINSEYFDNYKIKETDLILSDYTLNKLQKYEGDIASKTYEDGLNDAWELAKKVDEMSEDEFDKCFNFEWQCTTDFTYQEILAMVEAYEKSQQIQVGDVVKSKNSYLKFVVTALNGASVQGVSRNGDVYSIERKHVEKTGRHIDIQHLLEQIRGE